MPWKDVLEAAGQTGDADLQAVRGALREALAGMRTIATGLRTPELQRATPDEIARAKRSSRAG